MLAGSAQSKDPASRDGSSEPLVSVVTPTHNRADLLPETIESVARQDYPRLEHLVLDDGSTDGTVELLAGMTDRAGGRLHVHRHDNVGEQRTVNRGFSLARGEIVMVVNSDDPLLPGAVSAAVRALTRRPDLVAVYPDWQVIDEQGRAVRRVRAPEFSLERMLLFHECHPGPGAAIRRTAIAAVGGRDLRYRYVADFDFWLRIALHGGVERIAETLATWRDHGGAATMSARGRDMAAEHVLVIRAFFERSDLAPEVRALRRRSVSWSHYAAAFHAGTDARIRVRHVLAWAGSCPSNVVHWWQRHRHLHPTRSPWRTIGRRLRGLTD